MEPEPVTGQDLRNALAEYARFYEETGENRLPAMIYCLGSVLDFFRGQAFQTEHLRPLQHLLIALDSLNAGRQDPVLTPRIDEMNRANRRSGFQMFRRAMVLLVWEVLYSALGKHHGDKGRADDLTAKVMNLEGVPSELSDRFTGDIVRQWRNDPSPSGAEIKRSVEEYAPSIPTRLTLETATRGSRLLARTIRNHPGLEISTEPPSR